MLAVCVLEVPCRWATVRAVAGKLAGAGPYWHSLLLWVSAKQYWQRGICLALPVKASHRNKQGVALRPQTDVGHQAAAFWARCAAAGACCVVGSPRFQEEVPHFYVFVLQNA